MTGLCWKTGSERDSQIYCRLVTARRIRISLKTMQDFLEESNRLARFNCIPFSPNRDRHTIDPCEAWGESRFIEVWRIATAVGLNSRPILVVKSGWKAMRTMTANRSESGVDSLLLMSGEASHLFNERHRLIVITFQVNKIERQHTSQSTKVITIKKPF